MKAGSSGLNSSGAPSSDGGVISFMALSLARTSLAARTRRPPSIRSPMFASLTQGLRRAVQTKPNGTSTHFAGRRRTWQQTSDRVSRVAGALSALGVRAGRPGRHPGAEQRPLFRADVRHPVDRRRHGAAQHAAGGAGDRVHPGGLRRRGAVRRRRHGASPDRARGQDAERARGRSGSTTRPRPRACCVTRTSPTTSRPTMSARPTTTWPACSTPAARPDASKGVMLTHTNLVVNALNGVAGIGFNADTTYIHSGADVPSRRRRLDLRRHHGRAAAMPSCRASSRSRCCRPSQTEKVTHAQFVPTMINMLVNHPRFARVRHLAPSPSSSTAPRRCPRACCARPCR